MNKYLSAIFFHESFQEATERLLELGFARYIRYQDRGSERIMVAGIASPDKVYSWTRPTKEHGFKTTFHMSLKEIKLLRSKNNES